MLFVTGCDWLLLADAGHGGSTGATDVDIVFVGGAALVKSHHANVTDGVGRTPPTALFGGGSACVVPHHARMRRWETGRGGAGGCRGEGDALGSCAAIEFWDEYWP